MASSTPVRAAAPRSLTDDTAARIVDAALTCFTHYGLSKTTVEDVAAEAGCSRATLYRYFPGKQALIDGVVHAEVRRVAADLDAVLTGAESLEDLVVETLCVLGHEFTSHDALQRVLEIEPEVVLPHVAFDGAGRVVATASIMLAPYLVRFVEPAHVARVGEWIGRIALTYLFCPSEHVSLTDPDSIRRLVRDFVLPGIDPTSTRG